MTPESKEDIMSNNFTTNEEDQREAKKLEARLQRADDDDFETNDASSYERMPNVRIAEGAHKYVLITALLPDKNQRQHFVTSKKHASYHRNAAEPFVYELEQKGYRSISILGGGRITLDKEKNTIFIYGYSYGFGLADHAISKSVVDKDPEWEGYEVTWSNEGY